MEKSVKEEQFDVISNYLKNVDPSFFTGCIELFKKISKYMDENKVETAQNEEEKVPFNTIIRIIEQFYRSKSKDLGDAVYEYLRTMTIKPSGEALKDEDLEIAYKKTYADMYGLTYDEVDELENKGENIIKYQLETLIDSDVKNLYLNESMDSVVVGVHEVAHGLTPSDIGTQGWGEYEEIIKKRPFLRFMMVDEGASCLPELMCEEYLNSEYGFSHCSLQTIREDSLKRSSTPTKDAVLKSLTIITQQLNTGTITNFDELTEGMKLLANAEDAYQGFPMSSTTNSLYNYLYLALSLSNVIHDLGYLFGAYVYNKVRGDNSREAKAINDLQELKQKSEDELVHSSEDSFYGLGIIKNGKIVMDDEVINSLYSSFVQTYDLQNNINQEAVLTSKDVAELDKVVQPTQNEIQTAAKIDPEKENTQIVDMIE